MASTKTKAKPQPKGKNGKAPKPALKDRFFAYVKNVKSEMQRVVWPTRPELINASLIVLGALIFFGVFIAIMDNVVIVPLTWIANLG